MSTPSESGNSGVGRDNEQGSSRRAGRIFRVSPTPEDFVEKGVEVVELPPSPGVGTFGDRTSTTSLVSGSGGGTVTAGPSGVVPPLRVPTRRRFTFRKMIKRVVGNGAGNESKKSRTDDGEDSNKSETGSTTVGAVAGTNGTARVASLSDNGALTEGHQPGTNGIPQQSPPGDDGEDAILTESVAILPEEKGSSLYLEYFLAYLYYIGMSPIKPASAQELPKWIHWIQLAIFWTLSALAVLQALDDTKTGWIQFLLSEDMFKFICFGFFFANCLTRVYYIWLLARSTASILKLVANIRLCKINCSPTNSRFWVKVIAFGTGTFSLLLASVYTLFSGVTFAGWSFEEAALEASEEFSQTIFVWSPFAYENKTDELGKLYGSELDTTTKMFAALGSILTFCGTLHACVLLDLWLMVSLQIYVLACQLAQAMTSTAAHGNNGKCPLSIHWKEYLRLRDLCDESDNLFGKILALVHLQNLLQFCYLLLELLNKTSLVIYPIVDSVSSVKISIAYGLAKSAADKNEICKDCVLQCSECHLTIEIDGDEKSVAALLAQMERRPVGVGRGEFFVNQAFVIKFVCAVGSLFMLLAGESKEKCN